MQLQNRPIRSQQAVIIWMQQLLIQLYDTVSAFFVCVCMFLCVCVLVCVCVCVCVFVYVHASLMDNMKLVGDKSSNFSLNFRPKLPSNDVIDDVVHRDHDLPFEGQIFESIPFGKFLRDHLAKR